MKIRAQHVALYSNITQNILCPFFREGSKSTESYWSHEISSPKKCPKCSVTLEEEFHAYMLLVKEGSEVASFMAGNDGGWFCPNCPVVVLDHDKFANMAMIGGETQSGLFMVMRIRNVATLIWRFS